MTVEKRIATKLRCALDVAHGKGEFVKYWPFSRFPYDCCEHTCDILGYLLLEENINTIQINGAYIKDPTRRHVWLKTEKGVIIDITEDQFAGELLDEKDVEIVRVGMEGQAQKLFSKNRVEQPNTVFNDSREYTDFGNCPNPRQKRLIEVFKVIEKYL